eukprot:TRINITY_DN5618_c0_g1_i2.p1 TRINITY_DN5618_c0_g1~~TRINITY_DN5618_c0_g1_i2.p1  ORF type:complete len:243 (-),score=36.18 TRINITY_DN5618_c0_g1_i2:42-770(-)
MVKLSFNPKITALVLEVLGGKYNLRAINLYKELGFVHEIAYDPTSGARTQVRDEGSKMVVFFMGIYRKDSKFIDMEKLTNVLNMSLIRSKYSEKSKNGVAVSSPERFDDLPEMKNDLSKVRTYGYRLRRRRNITMKESDEVDYEPKMDDDPDYLVKAKHSKKSKTVHRHQEETNNTANYEFATTHQYKYEGLSDRFVEQPHYEPDTKFNLKLEVEKLYELFSSGLILEEEFVRRKKEAESVF